MPLGSVPERREWDSNPRRLAPHSFSRAAHLSALPSLPRRHARRDRSLAARLVVFLPRVLPRVRGVLVTQAAPQAPAFGLRKYDLAQTDHLGGHLDAFVVG